MSYAPALPLLQTVLDITDVDDYTLSEWGCIYIQHILRSNVSCVELLEKIGIEKNNLRIIGKSYSTCASVYEYYVDAGYCAIDPGAHYTYDAPFDNALIKAAKEEILQLLSAGISRILLIDEGGIAAAAASSISEIRNCEISIAELTSRGSRNFSLMSDIASIVDVGHSRAKKKFEAPIIATSMIDGLNSILTDLSRVGLCVGVIGTGAIGSSLIEILIARGIRVVAYDSAKSQIENLNEIASIADIVLSSTGNGIDLSSFFLSFNRDIVFGNCGSSDVEFRLWEAKVSSRKADCAFAVDNPTAPWRGPVAITSAKRRLKYLRGGFPINFDGSEDPITPHVVQLTRALLMAGAIQAITAPGLGVRQLRDDWQTALLTAFFNL